MENTLNLPLAGMADLFGLPLRKRNYVVRKLSRVAALHGYEQIEIPIVERASSFSEEIVGQSPWPEWDKRGCFYLQVPDYGNSYDDTPNDVEALLVPEGTISVTRWLGHLLSDNPSFVFPLKLYYEMPCFRNELVESLTSGKRRQFTQFGIEILGASSEHADAEAIYLITTCLEELGVSRSSVLVRIGDVMVFNRLTTLSRISAPVSIVLKEAMDAIAECKAGKGIERLPELRAQVADTLAELDLSDAMRETWAALVDPDKGDNPAVVAKLDDPLINERLHRLACLQATLENLAVSVQVDLCVVRSHEYYSGIAFEVDINQDGQSVVEVAGGGRYNKLVGHFIQAEDGPSVVPSTGFAFGVERLIALLDQLNLLSEGTGAVSQTTLANSSADVLIVPPSGDKSFAPATTLAQDYRAKGKRVDVYVGDEDSIRDYAAARRIVEVLSPE